MNKDKCNFFIIIFLLFLTFFIIIIPTYIHMGILMDPGKLIPDLSRKLHNIFVQRNTVTGSLYYNMLHKVPECAMPIAIIINGANMLYGFKKYKNKWWYYLILVLTIVMSLIILDCFHILIHQDDMA